MSTEGKTGTQAAAGAAAPHRPNRPSKITEIVPLDVRSMHGLVPEVINHQFRLIWGPALANGAAILALANIVANSQHQDTALDGLSGPFLVFGIGLLIGTAAILANGSAAGALVKTVILASALEGRARRLNLAIGSINEAPLTNKAEISKVRKDLDKLSDDLKEYDEEVASISRGLDAPKRVADASSVLGYASIAACGLGLAYLLLGHLSGWVRLEAPPPSPSAVVGQVLNRHN